MTQTTPTPLIAQYQEMKKKHPDAVLLFRVGDFYEMFGEDAITASEILGITLTRRPGEDGEPITLAGFPHHALDTYLPKLVRAGKRAAICEPQTKSKPNQKTKTMQTKRKWINCNRTHNEMAELGEPIAVFTVTIPKEAKVLGKCVNSKLYRDLSNICIEPERGLLYASDSKILSTFKVDCEGSWPQSETTVDQSGATVINYFRCKIDPKAIALHAGELVDVAVWFDPQRPNNLITQCESLPGISQCEDTDRYPDIERVIPQSSPYRFKIAESELPRLRKWLKANKGKPSDGKLVRMTLGKNSDRVEFQTYFTIDSPDGEPISVTLAEFEPKANIQLHFFASLFYLCLEGDFDGRIEVTSDSKPIKTLGEYRESILLPSQGVNMERPELNYCEESDDPVRAKLDRIQTT